MKLRQFDVILVDLGEDCLAGEQGGIRPCVVVQNDGGNIHSCTTIVLPLTKQIKKLSLPVHAFIKKDKYNKLKHDSMVLGECVRQISGERILSYIGRFEDERQQKEVERVYYANFKGGAA